MRSRDCFPSYCIDCKACPQGRLIYPLPQSTVVELYAQLDGIWPQWIGLDYIHRKQQLIFLHLFTYLDYIRGERVIETATSLCARYIYTVNGSLFRSTLFG